MRVRAAAHGGRLDRALELWERYWIEPGVPGIAAFVHVTQGLGGVPGDHPRYQALLEEAGIVR